MCVCLLQGFIANLCISLSISDEKDLAFDWHSQVISLLRSQFSIGANFVERGETVYALRIIMVILLSPVDLKFNKALVCIVPGLQVFIEVGSGGSC